SLNADMQRAAQSDFQNLRLRWNVDVIVVVTTPAALAVKKATTTIPIVHPNARSAEHWLGRQSCAPRRQSHRSCAADGGSECKTLGGTQKSSAQDVARCGPLESGQPRTPIRLERDASCGWEAGGNASIA